MIPQSRQSRCASSSTAYLHRHRRSPSIRAQVSLLNSVPQLGPNDFLPDGRPRSSCSSDSWRPSTISETRPFIPSGAVISPPDSESNSSSGDENACPPSADNKNKNQIMADLESAIISINEKARQHSSKSDDSVAAVPKAVGAAVEVPSDIVSLPSQLNFPTPPPTRDVPLMPSKPRSKIPPKLLHLPSSDGAALACASEFATHTPDNSDPEEDLCLAQRPPMVRKKSGELVRPALRKRPSSAPGTPTFSKAVHFDSHLEHIRHFLQLDRPLAVSAGSSPVEGYEGDSEFPFETNNAPPTSKQSPLVEWEARIANFPPDSEARKNMPVRLERIFLSPDSKRLIGVVAVANLAFHKHVAARFTLDYWRTTSEVAAEYNDDVRRKRSHDGYDRFNFSIILADQGKLDSKTMFICIRYNVNGLEFWDNNASMNYHVDFYKKSSDQAKPSSPSLGSRPAVAIPRTRSPRTGAPRPFSMPSLSHGIAMDSSHPRTTILSDDHETTESPLRLTSSAEDEMFSDTPTRRSKPTGQAFGNRYDFGASLSATLQSGSAGQTRRGPHLDLERTQQDPKRPFVSQQNARSDRGGVETTRDGANGGVSQYHESLTSSTSNNGTISGRPYHQCPVYRELVDKYCFVGLSPRR